MSFVVEIIAAASDGGIHVVGQRAIRSELHVILIEGEPGFEKLSSSEIVLVLGAGHVGRFHIFRIRELRALR